MARLHSRATPLTAIIALTAFAAAIAALALGGGSSAKAKPHRPIPGLHSLGSCGQMRAYLGGHRRAWKSDAPVGTPAPPAADGTGGAPAEAAPGASAGDSTGSPTNVQEAGVDEPDIVKATASTIFTIDGDTLRSVDARAPGPTLRDSIQLPGDPGGGEGDLVGDYQLLVAGDRLLAIGGSYGYAIPVEDGVGIAAPDIAYPGEPRMVVTEVDISDPSAMRVLETMSVEGSYVSARMTGSTVRLVTSHYPLPPAEPGDQPPLVPRMTLRDEATGEVKRRKLVRCGRVSRPSRFAGAETVSVLTIDLERGLPAVDVDSVLAGGQIVYASTTALYVATERWTNPDPAADHPAASQVDTEIHRFDISDPRFTKYVASGQVAGSMLSQWSMSEQEGLLRVASTTSPPWSPEGDQAESESFVSVLAPDGDQLRRVGRVGGLGRGERIYAVRFIGDAGYVVTFRQVDPLYVVDLTDATEPRVTGELKIPGYSAYLHPVGPGLLLGIGRDADAEGRTGGVLASLFDVSDPAHPTRLDRELFGANSSTEVEYDHHAFSWFADRDLAIVPIDAYDYSGGESHGAFGLRVVDGGADPLGRLARISRGESYEAQIRRTLEIGGRIYAVAANGVSSYDPATLSPLGSLDY